jgi:hypothetical protein
MSRRILFVVALSVISFHGSMAAAQSMDCTVRDPNPPLNVREAESGSRIVSTLPNGTRVFPVWSPFGGIDEKWIFVSTVEGGKWRQRGYVFRDLLACSEVDQSGRYPILIQASSDDLLRFGIDHSTRFPNRCFTYGEGGYHVSVSNAFKARYDRIGMPFENLCFILMTGGVRYDPESGRRLPTYMLGKLDKIARLVSTPRPRAGQPLDMDDIYMPGDLTEELPLEVPRCFQRAKREGRSALDVSACNFRYHPWSGKPLSAEEGAVFASVSFYIEGGAAPGTNPDDAKLALESRRRLSPAQIEAEARALR